MLTTFPIQKMAILLRRDVVIILVQKLLYVISVKVVDIIADC
jgi:hypothetical protein